MPALRPISSLKPADSVSATKWYGQIKASPSLGFMFDDMSGDDTMVLIPFSDGSYPWETYMLTREKPAPDSDLKLFRDHILEWMNEIKAGKRSR